jgi:hypothetical protein
MRGSECLCRVALKLLSGLRYLAFSLDEKKSTRGGKTLILCFRLDAV